MEVYFSRPVRVEVMKWNGSLEEIDSIQEWLGGSIKVQSRGISVLNGVEIYTISIDDNDNHMSNIALPNDCIVKYSDNLFDVYPEKKFLDHFYKVAI